MPRRLRRPAAGDRFDFTFTLVGKGKIEEGIARLTADLTIEFERKREREEE